MAWVQPCYHRGRVDLAGRHLVDPSISSTDLEIARAIINNWRAAHGYPLIVARMTLTGRAEKVDPSALVAQRLKRFSSVEAKLRRNENMQLSQMQDIGGCRAVVATATDVDATVALYLEAKPKREHDQPFQLKVYDYIANPKVDGYRSVHLVSRYKSTTPKHQVYDGQRIEVQIRSRLQHAWATTVEVVDTITGQSIKAGGGKNDWRRFFVLMSCAMAHEEGRPPVPSAADDHAAVVAEIRSLAKKLKVEPALSAYKAAVEIDGHAEGKIFLLTLDFEARKVRVRGYRHDEMTEASAALEVAEKRDATSAGIQTVLVTVKSLKDLRTAYPNYHLDTDEFLAFLERIGR